MRVAAIGVLGLVSMIGPGCAHTGRDADRAELLRLQALQQRAHLDKNASLLVSIFADDFVTIQKGQITRPSPEASRARFQAYFDRSTFLAWEDITPPDIHISGDGTMAYVIVHKRVRLRTESSADEVHTEFAWLETYEKRDGRWRLSTVTSTQRAAADAMD